LFLALINAVVFSRPY